MKSRQGVIISLKKEEGIRQVQEYLALEDVSALPKLRSYLLLTDGTEIEAVEVDS